MKAWSCVSFTCDHPFGTFSCKGMTATSPIRVASGRNFINIDWIWNSHTIDLVSRAGVKRGCAWNLMIHVLLSSTWWEIRDQSCRVCLLSTIEEAKLPNHRVEASEKALWGKEPLDRNVRRVWSDIWLKGSSRECEDPGSQGCLFLWFHHMNNF